MTRAWRITIVLLVLAWLGLQCWLLQSHWINPDEGAHLMDVRLAMEGLVPGIDYDARQPFYVYAYAPFLRLLGMNYVAGRVMPFIAIVLSAGLLWMISRRLWDAETGTAAVLGLLWAPLIVVDTAVVKTEPLSILLTCLGMYGLVRHLQERRWWPLWMAAASMGLAYYVRESSLAGLLAGGLVSLSLWRREGGGCLVRRLVVLAAGSGIVFLTVMGLYATRLSWGQVVMNEGLFPYYKIARAVGHITAWKAHVTAPAVALSASVITPSAAIPQIAAPTVVDAVVGTRYSQSWSATIQNLVEAVRFSFPWVMAALIGVVLWAQRSRRHPAHAESVMDRLPLTIVLAWLGSFALLYGYYAIQRGFFQFYFREFLPPMALLLAVVLRRAAARLGLARWTPWLLPAGIACGGLVFLAQCVIHGSSTLVALAAIAVFGGVVWWPGLQATRRLVYAGMTLAGGIVCHAVAKHLPIGGVPALCAAILLMTGWVLAVARWLGAGRGKVHARAFVVVALLAATAAWSASYAATKMGPAYDCIWSPQTLEEAVRVIEANSAPEDEVISGAVIWEFQAGRRPFAQITHPLGFVGWMKPATVERIMARLHERLPRLIVLDGYTEVTYLSGVPALKTLLRNTYYPVATVAGSKYPVTIYQRIVEAAGP